MAVSSKYSRTQASNLEELLNGSERFLVPQFQRNYAWTKDKANDLWCDLINGFKTVRDERTETQAGQYLLGSIVLVPDGRGGYYIIDGQQRLSTITMLFCVARDIILENTDQKPEVYNKIMEMVENLDMRGKHTNWKLVLNDTDKELFREIQAYAGNTTPQIKRIKKRTTKTKSEKLLVENYKLLYDLMMKAICADFNNDSDGDDVKITPDDQKKELVKKNISTLAFFLNHVKRNNFVVKIVVEDDETAYQIFETLNNRSQPLSKSNLIKNRVLNLVANSDEQREMSNAWNTIFDSIGHDEGDDVFLLDSLRSRSYEDKHSPKQLYSIIKDKIKTENDAKKYIRDLTSDADFLITLYDPTKYPDESIRSDIFAIKRLAAKSIRPPILAAYRKWYDEQKPNYERLVRLLLKFFFNVRTVRRLHAGQLEKIMMRVVKLIAEGESLQSIIDELQKHNDLDDFQHNFKNFMLDPRPDEANYVLRQITMDLDSKHSDVRPLDSLTLEHILPQKPSKWDMKEFFRDYSTPNADVKNFINHLGNLTLLCQAVNKKIQNELFSIKKTEYNNSNLTINKQTVCNYDKWTAKVIEERARIFANKANKIWGLTSR